MNMFSGKGWRWSTLAGMLLFTSVLAVHTAVEAQQVQETVESETMRVDIGAAYVRLSWYRFDCGLTDWFSVVRQGAPDDSYEEGRWAWCYEGPFLTLGPLNAGNYEARLYLNWPEGGYVVVDRLPFRVGASQPLTFDSAAPIPPSPVPVASLANARDISWGYTPREHREKWVQRFSYRCPPADPNDSRVSFAYVRGTDVYTDSSELCAAAIHAGVMTVAGGVVTIEIRPGAASYTGSTRNGISSFSSGAWPGSYVFVR